MSRQSNYLFTSESVSEGHPDKMADQISDGVLDALLEQDKYSRVACETLLKTGLVVLAGEITSKARIDYNHIVRDVIKEIGYTDGDLGFDFKSCAIISSINEQSQDIAIGVNENEGDFKEQGAGDQGIMFGYACNETKSFMPASLTYSHEILQKLSSLRREGDVSWLRPDAKAQVTVAYENDKLAKVDTVVVSSQHSEDVSSEDLRDYIIENSIKKVIPQNLLSKDTKFYVNPTGRFVVGGPLGDAGLTGRKIIVDTYGGHGAHGGGAFSGKDPSKVDRSAAYMARYIAKNIVGADLAEKCLVQLAYAIGVAEPVSVYVNTYGTNRVSEEKLSQVIREIFPLKPIELIEHLDLLRPIYRKTAAYGHFGREGFSWENLDKVNELRSFF